MAIENFTTYTEDDSTGVLTVVAAKITGLNVDRDITAFVNDDKGVNNYDGIDIDFELFVDENNLNNSVGGMGLTVSANSHHNDWGTTDILVRSRRTSGPTHSIRLTRGVFAAFDAFTAVLNTLYFCTLVRAAGSDTVTLEIYSDSDRTTLLDTLSVSGFGTGTKYRFLYGFVNNNDGTSNRDWDGYIQNMEDFSSPGADFMTGRFGGFGFLTNSVLSDDAINQIYAQTRELIDV